MNYKEKYLKYKKKYLILKKQFHGGSLDLIDNQQKKYQDIIDNLIDGDIPSYFIINKNKSTIMYDNDDIIQVTLFLNKLSFIIEFIEKLNLEQNNVNINIVDEIKKIDKEKQDEISNLTQDEIKNTDNLKYINDEYNNKENVIIKLSKLNNDEINDFFEETKNIFYILSQAQEIVPSFNNLDGDY